jgi:hypothetical protein
MELFEKILDLQTGKETMRPYTAAEIAEVEAAIAAGELQRTAAEKAVENRQAVLDKLGLTADELAALIG